MCQRIILAKQNQIIKKKNEKKKSWKIRHSCRCLQSYLFLGCGDTIASELCNCCLLTEMFIKVAIC